MNDVPPTPFVRIMQLAVRPRATRRPRPCASRTQRQRPVPRRRVPVVDVVEQVARVLGPRVRRDPPRVLVRVARVRQAHALAQAARADGLGLRAEARASSSRPTTTYSSSYVRPVARRIERLMRVRDDLPRVVVDHRADRLLAVRLGDPLHEERAVEVPDVALRPAARRCSRTRRASRRCPRARRRASTCSTSTTAGARRSSRVLSSKTASPSSSQCGCDLVGGERLAEDAVDERRDALDVIGVQDVRVLVRDELEVPVVDVAERRHVVGRGDVERDGVVRQRGRRAVGAVGLVGEDDLGASRSGPSRRAGTRRA